MRRDGSRIRREAWVGPDEALPDTVFVPGPAWPMGDRLCSPVFPLTPGSSASFAEIELRRPDGSVVRRTDDDWEYVWGGSRNLKQSVTVDHWRPGCVRVSVEGSDGRCVMRWCPGKLWWVQAWFTYKANGWCRWALQGTSWDTPPLDELSRRLPQVVAGWRREEPEVVRISDDGKGLTSYTKTAEVRWSRGDASVAIWVVPLRLDTIYEEAGEGSPPRQRTIHEAENYRVVIWQPSGREQVDTGLLTGLREALAAYPKATLDEYPLPRAAPGGKILEDDEEG